MGEAGAYTTVLTEARGMMLYHHLAYNMYPPMTEFYDTCDAAIAALSDGDWERPIPLPAGLLYEGEPFAPATQVGEAFRLDDFLVVAYADDPGFLAGLEGGE